MRLQGRVLSIAGSDCGGGAGVQADIKTITALGAYAATAITAITVQDTTRVHAIHPVAACVVADQIACVLADPGADAIKTGMLVDAATIAAVGAALARAPGLPVVVDPVLCASSGAHLLDPAAIDALRTLAFRATLLTPNLPEAAVLCGHTVSTVADMRRAAAGLRAGGCQAVLIKGGHLDGDTLTDLLVTEAGAISFAHPRQHGLDTHGTGCTLSAAIATFLAQGLGLADAVARAVAYVQAAIRAAPGLGAGAGPLNHAVTLAGPAAAA